MSDVEVVSSDVQETSVEQKPKSAPAESKVQKGESKEASETSEDLEQEEESDSQDENQNQEGDEESQEGKDKKPKKNGVQKRISKLTREKADLQRQLEYERSLRNQSKGDREEIQPKDKNSQAQAADGRPDPNNYETNAEYLDALTDWKLEQKEKAKEQKAKEEDRQKAEQKRLSDHQKRIAEFAKVQTDFAEAFESFKDALGLDEDFRVSKGLDDALVDNENGPAVMYELFKDPELFERINAMSPIAAAREVGKIEARLANASESKKENKKLTNAPSPITPVSAKGGSAVSKSLDDMEYEEFKRVRHEQLRKRR
jgi:hypothetical protein